MHELVRITKFADNRTTAKSDLEFTKNHSTLCKFLQNHRKSKKSPELPSEIAPAGQISYEILHNSLINFLFSSAFFFLSSLSTVFYVSACLFFFERVRIISVADNRRAENRRPTVHRSMKKMNITKIHPERMSTFHPSSI